MDQACVRLSNLHCHGWCTREQAVALVDQCEVLVLPSSVEAFGTVALEAMARQRLVITTPACGINEWPALARGLWVMQPDETLSTLDRLASLTSDEHRPRRRARVSRIGQITMLSNTGVACLPTVRR